MKAEPRQGTFLGLYDVDVTAIICNISHGVHTCGISLECTRDA